MKKHLHRGIEKVSMISLFLKKLPFLTLGFRYFSRIVPLWMLFLPLPAQNLSWAKQVGGTGFEESHAIATDAAGNVFVVGSFSGTADFDPGPGVSNLSATGFSNIFFAKYTEAGEFLWAKQLRCTELGVGSAVAVDGNGAIYVAGAHQGTTDFDPGPGTQNHSSAGNFDAFLAKFDGSGNLLWVRTVGGNTFDETLGLDLDAAGNPTISGSFTGTAQVAGGTALTALGNFDVFLARYDSNGNLLWINQIGGIEFDRVFGLDVDATGNVAITGIFEGAADFDASAAGHILTSQGNADIFVAKYDDSGALIWANSFGSFTYEDGRDVAMDPLGNVYITGRFSQTIDFNPGQGTSELTAVGINDAYFAKFDPGGNLRWAKSVGNADDDFGAHVAVDDFGNLFVSGQFIHTVDFDPGPAEANLVAQGDYDIFLAQYDSSGNFAWAKRIGGTKLDEVYALHFSGPHLYLGGVFQGDAEFDENTVLSSPGGKSFFFAKFSAPVVAVHDVFPVQVQLYPVPATDLLHIDIKEEIGPVALAIYDGLGRLRYRTFIREKTGTIPVYFLEDGVYYLNFYSDGRSKTLPFMVAH